MSEAADYYRHLKEILGGAPTFRSSRGPRQNKAAVPGSRPFDPGREPRAAADLMSALADELGWTVPLAESELIAAWNDVVGEETARHSRPEGIENGLLVIRCESTSWATQLRLMRADLLLRIGREYPDAGVESIRFQGPDVPSWKHGTRSIPGRGPRDTYG